MFPKFSWIVWYRPRPLCSNFPFTKLQTMKNLLFWTPPRRFDKLAPNFACSIYRPLGIKWQIPAYCVENRQSCISLQNTVWLLHKRSASCGMAWWGFVKNLVQIESNSWRSGCSLISVNGIKWGNLQVLFKTHQPSTSPCPSYVELGTPF